jgi:hypothetical protein
MSKQERYEAAVKRAKVEFAALIADIGELDGPGAGVVAAYFEMDSDCRDPWLGNAVDRSDEIKQFFDWMVAIAAYFLRHGRPMPAILANWAADVLEGELSRPSVGANSTLARNIAMGNMVQLIRDRYDLAPTRNGASAERSACDAVGAALGLSYKTVEAAWLWWRAAVS